MKSKDFIKMIQKVDPTGEAYIRLPGGIPILAKREEGYFDGDYCYINSEGDWVFENTEMKVDIVCIDLEDYVTNLTECEYDLETILSKVKHNYSNIPIRANDKINYYTKKITEYFNEMTEIINEQDKNRKI
jgi:hypothetical protein